MAFEAIGVLHWNDYSEVRPKPFSAVEPDFITACAQAHEDAGFDRMLIANSAHRPDSLPIATWAAAGTTRLKMMIAHRPGFIAPTMAARMFAILDRMSGGRCGVHIITGADDVEMQADGDFLTKDVRYERSAEYVAVMRRIWSEEAPFDHEGDFYRAKGAFAHVRPEGEGGIPVFWGGTSEPAIRLGTQIADVFAFPGFGLSRIAGLAAQVRAAAAGRDRPPDLLISTRVIVAATQAQAWDRARAMQRQLAEEVVDNGCFPTLPGEGRGRAVDRAIAEAEADGLDGLLWNGLSRIPTGRPALACLVGSTDQIIGALLDYHAHGVTRFIMSGYDPIPDALAMGQDLVPRLRESVERRARPA